MRKHIVIGAIVIIISIVTILCYRFCFVPVKYAVSKEDLLNSKEQYYLVQWVQVTSSSWMVVGDQNGYY